MYENMTVKYLFVNLKYPTYIKLQSALLAGWIIAAVLFYIYGADSTHWLWGNAWWICLVVAALEILESQLAIKKAKASYNSAQSS